MEDFDSKWPPVHNSFTYYLQFPRKLFAEIRYYNYGFYNCYYSLVPIKRVGLNQRVGWLGTHFAPQLISKFSTLLVYLALLFSFSTLIVYLPLLFYEIYSKQRPYSFIKPYSFNWHLRVLSNHYNSDIFTLIKQNQA